MDVSYKRDLNFQYLVITDNDAGKNDEVAMLLHNHISGLLDVRLQEINGECRLCYEITGMTPVSELFKGRRLKKNDITTLLLHFAAAAQEVSRYLLRGESLLLDAEYIFAREGMRDVRFCCCPMEEEGADIRINRLCRFILDHIDYDDRECVKLSYELFQESLKENITIESFIRHITDMGAAEAQKTDPAGNEEQGRFTSDGEKQQPEAQPRRMGSTAEKKKHRQRGRKTSGKAAALLTGITTAAIAAMSAYGVLRICARLGLLNGDRENAPVLAAIALTAAAGMGAFLYLIRKVS